MIRAFLRRLLCENHGVHRVRPDDRLYPVEFAGGFEGPCTRCPEWVTDDRSGSW